MDRLGRRIPATLCLFAVAALAGACGSDTGTGIPFDRLVEDSGGETDAGLDSGGSDAALDADADVADDAADDTTGADAGDATGDVGPDVDFPVVIASVDTRLSASSVEAGTTVYANCQARDADNELVVLDEAIVERFIAAPEQAFDAGESPDAFVPTLAGEATIGCSIPELGLIDATPAPLLIEPGIPATVITSVSQNVLDAGQSVIVTCEAFDAYGNAIDAVEATAQTDPFGAGVEVAGLRATFEAAGVYEVRCDTAGGPLVVPTTVEVLPGLPATLAIGLVPDLPRYGLNQVVSIVPTVQDRFGNFVRDAAVAFDSAPEVPSFGIGRFRFDLEGVFTLGAYIDGPTATGEELRAEVEVVVSGSGPAIECLSPTVGEMVDLAPGSSVRFTGEVSDEFGVAAVSVNDFEATIDDGGRFTADIPTRFGINFATIEAQDELGETSRRTCAFLVSDQWVAEGEFLADEVTLRLAQGALDDRDRRDGFDDIADFLNSALNSRGLRDQIHEALLGANPLYPSRCVQDSFLGCLLRVGVTYEDLRLNGPHDVSLSLIDSGLNTVATVRGIGVRLNISGTFSTRGWVNMSSLTVDLSFNVSLAGGRPSVTLRSLNNVAVGGISTDFSGLTGFVIDLVVDIFEDRIRDLVRDQIRDYIRDSFNEILDDIFSGLEIDTIADEFEVDRIDGGEPVTLGFGVRIDTADFLPARALFGVGARIVGDVLRGGETRGAAIPPGPVRGDPDVGRAVAAAINIALLNQALHALWRADWFNVSIGGDTLGDSIPDDAVGALRLDLPIVGSGTADGRARIMVGATTVDVTYPGIFDEPVLVEIGAVAETGVDIEGDADISFDDVTLVEFYFDTGSVTLDAVSSALLEEFLRALIQSVIDDAVNGALPTLPIPSFALPESLTVYDIPAGDLRLLDPVLTLSPSHFIAAGNFGVR